MKKFIYLTIFLFVGYFFINSIYQEINKDKTPGKAKRIACQKELTTFERAFDTQSIHSLQKSIESGKIQFSSDIEKSIYSKSTLFEYLSLAKTDMLFRSELSLYQKNNLFIDHDYNLHYYIYENDKNDPGKKNKKSKNYAGYVVLEVKNNNQIIYKVQVDFMDEKGLDIDKSFKCIVKSLMTFK
jgi:hypothetical protein